jgi:putative colanic acid biosynthesis UDP-glucose lipid carrier transferase
MAGVKTIAERGALRTTVGVILFERADPVKKISLRNYIDKKRVFFALKRVADVAVSLFLMITVLSWLVPLIAILIKLDSRGPVFFRQKRVGKAGRGFMCIKFRTMVMNKDADLRQAELNDRRITRLGKFLRDSNIDELPQLFNVLEGSMSLVGPRPHMYADCARFSSVIPGYKFRNLVRPGITGLAQVKGYHGPTCTTECITERFRWDAAYIRHASARMDMSILFNTIRRALKSIF